MDVLWHIDSMVWGDAAVSVLAVTAGLWGVNALLQNRITPVMCAFVQFAAMATAASACGWVDVYNLAKPIALLLLMYLAWSADNLPVKAQTWLVRALGLSWVGDVLLLYPGLFVPGLVAFLVAHLCYFKLLSLDAPLLSSKRAVDLPPASRTNVMFVKSVTMENDGHEEEQIYRRTDHWVLAASRSRHADQGVVPQRRF
jgi:hypothetical protein